mmetsp:Transcript_19119/g.62755  ORF Transcript_19119/g.62755 Transcript_19119/m.62755 type:complete len:268 (-) Transcript_19119:541-1344(-)
MSKHFSPPMSAPKPASVTTKPSSPTNFRPTLSATTDELPWAMLAKGPACTSTGVPSMVCMSVGSSASFMSTARAPAQPKSSAVTMAPPCSPSARDRPTHILPSRFRKSAASAASASTAMISDATAMSKPASRVMPFSLGPLPISTLRRKRSQVSSTRFHVIVAGSRSRRANLARCSGERASPSTKPRPATPNRRSRSTCDAARGRLIAASFFFDSGQSRLNRASSFCVASWKTRASTAAASKLFAATIAWMSPVMWRLNSSMGMTWL